MTPYLDMMTQPVLLNESNDLWGQFFGVVLLQKEKERVSKDFTRQIQRCLQRRGAHLKGILDRQSNKEFLQYRSETSRMSRLLS